MYEVFGQPPAWDGLGGDASEPIGDEDDPRVFIEEVPEEEYPAMEVTYVMFGEEPGFDGVYEQAGELLKAPGGMIEQYKIMPVNIDGSRKLYSARFEIGTFGNALQHPEAVLDKASQKGTVGGWIDFMTGFPVGCIELQALIGEISSRPDLKNDLVESVQDPDGMTPAFPKTLFGGYADSKILMNLMYLSNDYSDFMADDLQGEDKPAGLRWWLRVNLMSDVGGSPQLFPYPGEFCALAVRLFPDRVSFSQESNPFYYSGCFCDTCYFSSGYITEIIEPTDDIPYPQYKVRWRKNPAVPNDDGIYTIIPTDFTSYEIGDRVVLLKDVETTKTSQLWKDLDMTQMDPDDASNKKPQKVSIVPIMFFGIDVDQPVTT